ncbi:MAG: Gfo/Idh/MocA family oxidoreductase [Bryobacteraceae bacterium]|nr:Gfo/Idh/MocA family oxidoreductase [Bryobacteraceae bacterium]
MADKLLRGGIIGCGFFAQFHIDAWRRMHGVALVTACDPDLSRAVSAAPRAYQTAEEMLDRESLDFVDIATRPETHFELVRLATSRGIPVICQKPLAPTASESAAVARLASESGVRVMVHENWRWQPWYRAVKRLIADGAVGRPLTYRIRTVKPDGYGPDAYPTQPYFRDYRRLILFETMIHHLDTARFLFGDVAWLYAQARRNNPLIQGEDEAHVMLTHTSGLIGAADGHRFLDTDETGPAMGEAWFEGEGGVLHVAGSGHVRRAGHMLWENTIPEGYRGDSVKATQEHFIHCLRTGEEFESEVREYLKTIALVEAAYTSIDSRAAVEPRVPD